jgi:hypothetical protein
MKSKAKIKLFRGDQLLIPGAEGCFNVQIAKVSNKINRKRTSRKRRPAGLVQLALQGLTPCDTNGTV